MSWPRDQWPLRLVGCLFGGVAWLLALYLLLGADPGLPELERERASGFASAALVVGAVAILGSLFSDPRALWYCTPKRWRLFRDGR